MIDAGQTVSGLVARFELRRRATTDTFHAGVHLARTGAVSIESLVPEELRALVRDPEPETVRIVVEDDGLAGHCSCVIGEAAICRHQVAAAHALWMREWMASSSGK